MHEEGPAWFNSVESFEQSGICGTVETNDWFLTMAGQAGTFPYSACVTAEFTINETRYEVLFQNTSGQIPWGIVNTLFRQK